MSSFSGIYCFQDVPVDAQLLASLGTALSDYGPDSGGEILLGSIGMTFRAFHTNKESCKEVQPFVSDDGPILCWDGRLDNREDLISDCHNRQLTDVQIVSELYLQRSGNFPTGLIGDFAFSLWDRRHNTLMLARDPMGPRPLFYHANQCRVVWSSNLLSLVNLPDLEIEVNDEYVAGYLTRGVEPHLTPYREVCAVPPGCVVLFSNGQCLIKRFWSLSPGNQIHYKNDGEYEEHFLSLFRQAIRCRLRVNGPVWTQLSGGLDSSSIVCIADEILENGEAEAPKLETVSYIYDESGSSDERTFIESVEEKRGRVGYHLSDSEYPALASFPTESQKSFPDFLDCFTDRHEAMCAAMRQSEARVLLTGHGGDEMLCGSASPSPGFGDLLTHFRLFSLHHSLRDWSKALKKSYAALLWHDAIVPLLPRSLQTTVGRAPRFTLPPWFDQRFIERMSLRQRSIGLRDIFGFDSPSGRDQAVGLLSIIRFVAKTSYRDRGFIEVSHPYLHRPLVEFLQAIPFEQRVRPGETKTLLRRALRRSLPPKVLNRRSKRGPDEALMRAIARNWSNLQPIFMDARVCARGYVNRDALNAALERARHGCELYTFALIQTISLEFWLRSLEHRSPLSKNLAAVTELQTPMVATKSGTAYAPVNSAF